MYLQRSLTVAARLIVAGVCTQTPESHWSDYCKARRLDGHASKGVERPQVFGVCVQTPAPYLWPARRIHSTLGPIQRLTFMRVRIK